MPSLARNLNKEQSEIMNQLNKLANAANLAETWKLYENEVTNEETKDENVSQLSGFYSLYLGKNGELARKLEKFMAVLNAQLRFVSPRADYFVNIPVASNLLTLINGQFSEMNREIYNFVPHENDDLDKDPTLNVHSYELLLSWRQQDNRSTNPRIPETIPTPKPF